MFPMLEFARVKANRVDLKYAFVPRKCIAIEGVSAKLEL